MAIYATDSFTPRELIPAGNYIARCYQMIEIGTIIEQYQGEAKTMKKVVLGWELPMLLKEGKPSITSMEFTLSMGEKSNLRKMLASWRGRDFTQEQAKNFDVTKLLGVPCMLNLIHKATVADASKMYEKVASLAPIPTGITCPAQVNPRMVFEWEQPNWQVFEGLPNFVKDKIKSSSEFIEYAQKQASGIGGNAGSGAQPETIDDLPF